MARTLPAKLTPPRLGRVLNRQRLFEKLDNHLDHGLTWICSPPGSGKSILAASYLEKKQRPIFWYRVDEGDEDIASFFYYLGLAAKKINSDAKKPLPSFSPEFLERIDVFSRLFFRHLFEHLTENGVLVFDNLDLVPTDSLLHQVLTAGLSEIPHGMQAMLLSRSSPPKSWSPLLINKQIATMDWLDIQLTKEETLEIANQQCDKKLTNKTLQQIYDFTQGWAAGLALILAQSDDMNFEDTPSNISNEGIFYFFSTVFWDTLKKDEQCILLAGALLPSISSDGLTQLCDKANAIDVLARLHRHHCFTVQLENGEYQYHPLFFLFLLNRLEQCYNTEQLRSVRQKAAEYLMRKDQAEPAAKLLQEATAWPELVQLICTQAPFLLEHGRQKTLSDWLSGIPGEIFKQQPWLYYWQGQIMLTQDMASARQNFITAFEELKQQAPGDPAALLLACSGIIDTYTFVQDMDISANDWVTILESLLKQYPEIHNTSVDVRITLSMLNFFCFCHPYSPSLRSWITRGECLISENSDVTIRLQLAGIISYYYIWVRGNPKKADNIIRPFRPFIQKLPLSNVQALTQATFSSFSLLWLGRHDEFINHCHRALEQAQALGSHDLELQFLLLLMYPHLIQGEYQTAEHLATQAAPLVNPHNPYLFSHFQSLLAWQDFQAGHFKLALEHAQLALQDSYKINQLSPQIAAHLGMAQILLSLGRKNEAQIHFDQFLTLSKDLPGSFFLYMSELFLARVALETDNKDDARQHLRTGLALAREQGFFFIWWWHPAIMVRLCCFALEEGIETDYVRELISHNRLLAEADTVLPDNWPWKVKITVLGDLSVLVDNKPLKTSGKAQHKLMEFLKVLIVLGGRNVAQENLIDILWPDVDGDAGRRTFDTTLHRLRKELGDKRVLTLSNGYLSLDSRFCWLDTWSLEALVKKTNDALDQSDTAEISALTERLLQLYRGPLLTQKIETNWLLHARELFQQRFWNLIDQIGNYHELQKSWDMAIACYQQGLEREPLSEPFYRRLICIYQRMGRNDESRAVYQQCLHALASVGRQPSKNTESCSEACKPVCWKTGQSDF